MHVFYDSQISTSCPVKALELANMSPKKQKQQPKKQGRKKNKPAAARPKKEPDEGVDQLYPRDVNGYRLEKKLGEGSYGVVSLAIKIEPIEPPKPNEQQKQYAIKAIDLTTSSIKETENEIDIMQQFNHRNIMRLLEHFELNGHVYLVMDFMKGGDLYGRIETKPYTEKSARKIFKAILKGLAHLHEKGVAHRDFKPENGESFRKCPHLVCAFVAHIARHV